MWGEFNLYFKNSRVYSRECSIVYSNGGYDTVRTVCSFKILCLFLILDRNTFKLTRISDMVKYRAALWSFLKLTALVFYHVWYSPSINFLEEIMREDWIQWIWKGWLLFLFLCWLLLPPVHCSDLNNSTEHVVLKLSNKSCVVW